MMLPGPVGTQVITVIVSLAQKAPEKDKTAQRHDDHDVGEAFRAKHEIMQCVDGVPHGFVSDKLLAVPGERSGPFSIGI
jgi:hypothetical protein